VIAESFAAVGAGWLRGSVLSELFPLLLTPVLLAGMWYRNALSPMMRRGYAVLLGVVIVAFGALCLARARRNVIDPPRWDVQAFWLFGKVAVVGDDFYRPESFHAVADSLRAAGEPVSTAGDFNRELLDVGFPYPPMTMLLFAPLGLLGLHAAALLWYLVIIASTAAVIGVLWHRLFEPPGMWELAFTTAMVLTLRATYSTYAFGQTGFLLLLCLLLFWRDRNRISGGAYLALAIVVKPIAAFFLGWTVLDRRWRSVLATVLVLAGLAAVTALAFGTEVFTSFITSNSVSRMPHSYYSSNINQSLLATWVRATHYDFSLGSPLRQPAFIAMILAIAGVTFGMEMKLGRSRSALGLALGVPAALLVYPQTLEHYSVLLLLPLLFIWTRLRELDVSPVVAVTFLTLEYALVRYQGGRLDFFAVLLCWVTLLVISIRAVRHSSMIAKPGWMQPSGAAIGSR
jgi:hypothetical protein